VNHLKTDVRVCVLALLTSLSEYRVFLVVHVFAEVTCCGCSFASARSSRHWLDDSPAHLHGQPS
jgi:hypothetical protein